MLHQSGFTDVRLRPEDEQQLLTYGCGITAVVTRPTARADEIRADEFCSARQGFEEKMQPLRPRVVAFLGKRAVSSMLEIPHMVFGLQSFTFAGATAWVLPNPSGLNRGYTVAALVSSYTELRVAFPRGHS